MIVQRKDKQLCTASAVEAKDKRRLKNVSLILIHRNTAGADLDGVHAFHSRPGVDAHRIFPYHFFIDYEDDAAKMGCCVYQINELEISCQHSAGENYKSIGVCLNVDGRSEAPSGYMIEQVSRLCARLLMIFPKASIRGHSIVKQCPGKLIPVSYIDSRARAILLDTQEGTQSDDRIVIYENGGSNELDAR